MASGDSTLVHYEDIIDVDIKWSENQYSLKQIVEMFGDTWPQLIQVHEGIYDIDCRAFSIGDVLKVHGVRHEYKILATVRTIPGNNKQFLTIPRSFRGRLEVIPDGQSPITQGEEFTVDEILDNFVLPVQARFSQFDRRTHEMLTELQAETSIFTLEEEIQESYVIASTKSLEDGYWKRHMFVLPLDLIEVEFHVQSDDDDTDDYILMVKTFLPEIEVGEMKGVPYIEYYEKRNIYQPNEDELYENFGVEAFKPRKSEQPPPVKPTVLPPESSAKLQPPQIDRSTKPKPRMVIPPPMSPSQRPVLPKLDPNRVTRDIKQIDNDDDDNNDDDDYEYIKDDAQVVKPSVPPRNKKTKPGPVLKPPVSCRENYTNVELPSQEQRKKNEKPLICGVSIDPHSIGEIKKTLKSPAIGSPVSPKYQKQHANKPESPKQRHQHEVYEVWDVPNNKHKYQKQRETGNERHFKSPPMTPPISPLAKPPMTTPPESPKQNFPQQRYEVFEPTQSNHSATRSTNKFSKPIDEMTVEEVGNFLRSEIHIDEETIKTFAHNDVDGELLTELNIQTLKSQFNISDFNAIKITKYIRGWRPKHSIRSPPPTTEL